MSPSGIFSRVVIERTNVSEERITIITVTKIGKLGTTLTTSKQRAFVASYC
jgi:hypothetical protein